MRYLLLVPLLLGFAGGTEVFFRTDLYRDQNLPFADSVGIPPLPEADTVVLEIEGAAYTELTLHAVGPGTFTVGSGQAVQGAALGSEIVLELVAPRPGFSASLPAGAVLTLIWLDDFAGTVEVPVAGLPGGETVQWLGNTSGWSISGGGSWGARGFARHTLRGTIRVLDDGG